MGEKWENREIRESLFTTLYKYSIPLGPIFPILKKFVFKEKKSPRFSLILPPPH